MQTFLRFFAGFLAFGLCYVGVYEALGLGDPGDISSIVMVVGCFVYGFISVSNSSYASTGWVLAIIRLFRNRGTKCDTPLKYNGNTLTIQNMLKHLICH